MVTCRFLQRLAVLASSLALSLPAPVLALTADSAQTKPAPGDQSVAPAAAWRKSPPELPPPKPVQLPQAVNYKMDNGLDVVLLEDHRVPFFAFQLAIKAGSSFDPQDMSGLASLTADLLTEGTAGRTSKQIADEVDFIGGALKGASDADFTLVSGSALPNYKEKVFEMLADVLLKPSFPEDELKLQKTNLLQALSMKRSQPSFLVDERFDKVVFGNHPYSVVAPTPESVEKIKRADLIRYHAEHYLPNQAVLVVVGDFKTEEMKGLIEKSLAAWKAGTLPAVKIATPPRQSGRKIYLVDRPGSVQSSIKLGNIGIQKNDPDYFAVIVANQILGGSSLSRLFLNIRENKGYTYGAYSSFTARRSPGDFSASAEVRTPVTGHSLQEFLYEMDKIRNTKASDKELDSAKNFLAGSFQMGLETQGGIAQRLLEQKVYGLPEDYLRTYTTRLMAVTGDDVRRVARKHIDLDNIVITVVGDGKKIKSELEYFAPIETYDTTGKLISGSQPRTSASH